MQFIGIRDGILCLLDLGFAYLDDGTSTLRLSTKHFDELLATEVHTAELPASVAQYSRFFTLYSSRAAAAESMVAASWTPTTEASQ